jgi:glycosyltransferase involved in cell wall biosynthesis
MRGEPAWQREAQFMQHAPMTRQQQPQSRNLPVRFSSKKIALVAPSRASLAVMSGSLINEIGQGGHHTFCFAPELKDRAASEALQRLRARIVDLPAFGQGVSPIADQRAIWKLVTHFRALQPDIVAGYSPKGAVITAIAAKLARVPHVVSVIGELGRGFEEAPDESSFFARQYQKAMLRLAFQLSDTGVFFNDENYELLQRHGLIPERLRQFPMNGSGVDLRRFPVAQLPPINRGVMFLYAGPLDKRFGIAEFCKAARILRSKPGNYQCIVVGPEVRGPHAFPLAALKRYRDVVHYAGPQTDPRPAIAHTHVFVFPARGDVVPQALVEAVAMGRPVITSTSRGCRVAVSEGANGMIVPPGDAQALAGAMARLLQRPDLIPSMSRASRELAEAEFDARRINGMLLAALDL